MARCQASSVSVDKSAVLKVGLGGGCHWCTEAVFQALNGVSRVEQGFCRSDPPHETWSEAVIVHFDETLIGLDTLVAIHLRTHAATSAHKMRGKYRSAVYTFNAEQAADAERLLELEAAEFGSRLVTQVLPHRGFKLSAPRFRNYYATRPDRPFCKTYVDPKLAEIRRVFTAHVRSTM
ncbi:MAG: peptide-methionine (S)-S-oxide reductase [Pseudomonadota bacterium]